MSPFEYLVVSVLCVIALFGTLSVVEAAFHLFVQRRRVQRRLGIRPETPRQRVARRLSEV